MKLETGTNQGAFESVVQQKSLMGYSPPAVELIRVDRRTEGKYATVVEYTTTTGPGS